jgi:ATP-dependent RNA helicase DDX10/DBP4
LAGEELKISFWLCLFSLLLTWNFESPDDSDSELDVLKIKRRDHELEIPSAEESIHQNAKKKAVTKVAVAKKILKKKIIANKKTLFNDEGEVRTQIPCFYSD